MRENEAKKLKIGDRVEFRDGVLARQMQIPIDRHLHRV